MMTGGCLCQGVRYRIGGELAPPVACHCSQCGRTSGNFAVMAKCEARGNELHTSPSPRSFHWCGRIESSDMQPAAQAHLRCDTLRPGRDSHPSSLASPIHSLFSCIGTGPMV